MKRKILLTLATALLTCIGAYALDDVTATYITNASFEACETATMVDGVVQLVANDKTPVNYESAGWKVTGGFDNSTSYNAGVATYPIKVKYSKWLNGLDGPEAGPTATAGSKALCFTGNKSAVYVQSQDVTLPAGTYKLTVNVWAYNGGTTNPAPTIDVTVATGFVATDGTKYMSEKKMFTSSGWDVDEIEFELTAPVTGHFQISYGASYFVTIDDLKLEYEGGVVTSALKKAVDMAYALQDALAEPDANLQAAIEAAEAFIANPDDQAQVPVETQKVYAAMQQALLASTTPVNLTSVYMLNPSFETGKQDPWTGGKATIGDPTANSSVTPNHDGNNVAEFTTAGTNNLLQTIANLPVGYYYIDALLRNAARLVVGSEESLIQGGTDEFYSRVFSPIAEFDGGELTVGSKGTGRYYIDGFRFFFGNDKDQLIDQIYADAVANAQNFLDNPYYDDIVGEERTALEEAVAASGSDKLTLVKNMQSATAKMTRALSSYATFAKAVRNAEPYNAANYPYGNKELLATILSIAGTQPASATAATELAKQLDDACFQYYVSNAYCEGVTNTDYTDHIVGANATTEATGWATQNMAVRTDKTGWTNPKTGETDKVVYGVTSDYYSSCANTASILKQTVKELPAGNYVLSMTMMGSSNLPVYVFFNREQIGTMNGAGTISGGKYGAGWNEFVFPFTKADATDMPIQLQCKPESNYKEWYVDNFRLYRLADDTTTGISAVGNALTTPADVYDLQGRRIQRSSLSKGLYIVGGRKVIRK